MTSRFAPPPVPGAARRPKRSEIVGCARAWLGTPYHHQASLAGVGTDCLGLVRGIYREIYGLEAEEPPAYSPDWADATGAETLFAAARRHLCPRSIADAAPGDILLFRLRTGLPAKHLGILSDSGTLIHAVEGRAVLEEPLTAWWKRRLAASFSFPGVID